jgi:hypothetical protein
MSDPKDDPKRQEQALEFMQGYFGLEIPEPEPGMDLKAHTTLTRENQPEFYADAPWRLEPDQDQIPLLFTIREANLRDGGRGPWRLSELRVEQQIDGAWHPLQRFGPGALPGVDADGFFERGFWSYATSIDLDGLQGVDPGARDQMVALRVVFDGRFPPHDQPDPQPPHRYLQVHLAAHPLPMGRAASAAIPAAGGIAGSAARTWFYGDTHYHSAHTNDVWEFGNPVADARRAGMAIGLDWLAITDHSCDLDEPDLDDGGLTRWQRLKQDLDRPTFASCWARRSRC